MKAIECSLGYDGRPEGLSRTVGVRRRGSQVVQNEFECGRAKGVGRADVWGRAVEEPAPR